VLKNLRLQKKTALDFIIRDVRNNVIYISQYKGDVVLMVNTVTECGLTPQFTGLQNLYEKYRDQGFVILGFPSNSFKQENKTEEEIITFCSDNFLVDFSMFRKVDVKGTDQHEIYKFLTDPATNLEFQSIIRWNFEKFLIGRDGQIIGRFAPEVTPEDPELITAIEDALDAGWEFVNIIYSDFVHVLIRGWFVDPLIIFGNRC